MSDILALAEQMQKQSEKLLETSKNHVLSDIQNYNKSIERELKSSEKIIRSGIQKQQKLMQQSLQSALSKAMLITIALFLVVIIVQAILLASRPDYITEILNNKVLATGKQNKQVWIMVDTKKTAIQQRKDGTTIIFFE